ncbi:hypothetical protein Tco_0116271 [Tanacetum coccineum]
MVEKMESVSQVSNYDDNCQMKFATCTLLDGALTWWNTHMKTVGIDAAYQTSWTELKKMMTTEYCLKNEELALLCLGMVPEEEKKIERLYELTVQEVLTTKGNGRIIKEETLCNHQTSDKRWLTPVKLPLVTAAVATQRCLVADQKPAVTYFGYGAQGHYNNECPKARNQNNGNQNNNGGARERAFSLYRGEAVQDPNIVMALGWHLEEIHVTWDHLEKKQTRLRLYTKNHVELCIKRVETASPS